MTTETWNCVYCALERHKFGAIGCNDDCPNRTRAHITGAWYLASEKYTESAKGIGISEIADDNKDNGSKTK